MKKFRGQYPAEWRILSYEVKRAANNRCIRCQRYNDPARGYTLTVHHLDNDKSNLAWWNLVALCQRCHLQIQGKVVLERTYMLEHTEWIKPYVAGYYAASAGLPCDRDTVEARLNEYLAIGQPHLTEAARAD
jgi:hypothetical protein